MLSEKVRRGHLLLHANAKVLATVFCNQTQKTLPAVIVTGLQPAVPLGL